MLDVIKDYIPHSVLKSFLNSCFGVYEVSPEDEAIMQVVRKLFNFPLRRARAYHPPDGIMREDCKEEKEKTKLQLQ